MDLSEIPIPEPGSALIKDIIVHEAHAEFLQSSGLKKEDNLGRQLRPIDRATECKV